MYPSTVARAREVILGRDSKVPAASVTGGPPDPRNAPAPYSTFSMGLGFKVSDSKEDFQSIHEQFLKAVDLNGTPMIEIAKKYWSDPEWAEFQRRGIVEKKRRGGR